MIHIFFFQAEDGIRDLTVTGVQTCALPIWNPLTLPQGERGKSEKGTAGQPPAGLDRIAERGRGRRQAADERPAAGQRGRSGERCVGERGRSRGAPDHLKKKNGDSTAHPPSV